MRKELKIKCLKRLFCVLTAGLFLLSACQKAEQGSVERTDLMGEIEEVESDYEYGFVAESEHGYYSWERVEYIREPSDLALLVFMDIESQQVVPLCNKPDCMHDSEECNAYYSDIHSFSNEGMDKHYIQYYEDSIYAIGLGEDDYVSLFRIEADGSEWEESTKLYRTDYSSTGHWRVPEVLVADGYVYFIDYKQKSMTLTRMPIGGTKAEVIYEDDSGAEVQVHRVKYRNGSVYFQVVTFPEGKYELHEAALYRYDTVDGQCSLVKEGIYGSYSVRNDLVYYVDENGLFCYSIQEQNEKTVVEQPLDYPTVTLTEDYIVLCDIKGDGTLSFYDYEGKEVATVSGALRPLLYLGGNSDMLFAECTNDNVTRLCFMDLKKPLDELQWEDFQRD